MKNAENFTGSVSRADRRKKMKKVAVVYFSQTGNTEEMAAVVKDSLEGKAEAVLIPCDQFTSSDVGSYDAFAFGCPAMGNEVLEEDSFEPMFTTLEGLLEGMDVVLFGSYGWGDGEWMRSWNERCLSDKMVVKAEPVICQESPDENTKDALKALAEALIA